MIPGKASESTGGICWRAGEERMQRQREKQYRHKDERVHPFLDAAVRSWPFILPKGSLIIKCEHFT